MRNVQMTLRRGVLVALVAAMLWAWGGAPLLAAGAAGPAMARVEAGGLISTLPGWLGEWLGLLGAPGWERLSAPGGAAMDPDGAPTADGQGGGAMDPDGSPTSGEPSVDEEGGGAMDPNG